MCAMRWKRLKIALAAVAHLVGALSCELKGCRFTLGQGTCVGCRFDPLLVHRRGN